MLPILLLLTEGLVRRGVAVQVTGEPASASARLLRNEVDHPDQLSVELDSEGESHVQSTASLAATRNAATTPTLVNGGFEDGSVTQNYQYSNYLPGWSKVGDTAFIKSGGAAFQTAASHGDYLIGLAGKGSGVYQTVSGHIPGTWYRLIFHSAYRTTHAAAKLKVSIDSSEKMKQEVASGTLTWYEVTYKAPYADVVIAFDHEGPDENYGSTIFLDGVDIKAVQMWDSVSNSAMLLLQKVTCNGYPSESTCNRGDFLTTGDYDEAGATNILQSHVANEAAVWVAIHKGGKRWSFKSNSLNQPSPDGEGPARSGTMWYLHSDYSDCQARNWFGAATSSFHVELNSLGFHEISDVGTECGSLFAIQHFAQAETR